MGMIGYIKKEMGILRLMGYSIEYSEDAKKLQGGGGNRPLTAREHSDMSAMDFREHYSDRQTLFKWYFEYLSNINKLSVVTAIARKVRETGAKNVISIGCGPGVLECILKEMLGNSVSITAMDYDVFLVDEGNRLLGREVQFERFDFFHDDVRMAAKKHNADMLVMIGSACSMDNETYVRFLRECGGSGIKTILSFEAAVSGLRWYYARMLAFGSAIKRYIKRMPHRQIKAGHAYARGLVELKGIYRAAGWKAVRMRGLFHKYTYCLTRD